MRRLRRRNRRTGRRARERALAGRDRVADGEGARLQRREQRPAPRDLRPRPMIGLGTAPLAGLYEPLDEATALAAIERAWELGIRFFDTAPYYGGGLAEHRLGAALRERPRAEYTLSTKVG